MNSYDLAVIGSGPGGYVAAIRASQLDMRVAIVEADRLGGVCLNWGCIPSKAILSAAELYEAVKQGVPGLRVQGLEPDFGAVIDASRVAADRLHRGVGTLMSKNKIDVYEGWGSLAGKGQVLVKSKEGETALEARHVLIATGSREWVLPGVTVDGKRVLTSREALESRELPGSIVVIGGGAVGCEFAYAYQAYGAQVTIVEMLEQLLPGMDAEVAKTLERSFTRRKVKVLTQTFFKSLEVKGDGVVVTLGGEKGEQEIQADQVLFAVGRKAIIEDIGLEGLGVETDRGFVRVNAEGRTSVEGIWAIGDVKGPPLLAHKASEEGIAAVEFMAGKRTRPIDPRRIPACIFCQPQVASVGLTEEEARAAGHDVRVGKFPFGASGKAVATGHTDGFMKLVVDGRYGEILGCQGIGSTVSELVAEVTVAMNLESTVREIGETNHAHPTLSEAIMEAALAAEGRSINF
jgi:dihydrolipoamide dehydrogenase